MWPNPTCLLLFSFMGFVLFSLYINHPIIFLVACLGFGQPNQLPLPGTA
jgi:hypothetical protein